MLTYIYHLIMQVGTISPYFIIVFKMFFSVNRYLQIE